MGGIFRIIGEMWFKEEVCREKKNWGQKITRQI